MIIMHEYPLSIVDHVGFKRYSSYLQPLFKVPCRNTINNEIFHIYEVERAKTMSLLDNDVFTRLGQRESQYKSICPSREEWEFAQDVCGRLKKKFKATEIFSGTKYPTANQCFINICEIRLAITDWRRSSNFMIQTMAEKMLIKFEKYWDVMHGVVGVAAVLDPRYKMEVLEFYFDKIFGETSLLKVDNIRELCYSLLKEYHEKLVAGNEGIGDSTSTRCTHTFENVSEYDLFISTKKRKRVDSIKSELDHYLDEDVVQKSDGFDLLNWWKVNELKYPNLQRMAQDFLAIPVSTVASESAFSSSGRLVSPHCNRLHPKTIEVLMCAQSWLWAAEMQGESSIGYATIYNDLELEDSCVTRLAFPPLYFYNGGVRDFLATIKKHVHIVRNDKDPMRCFGNFGCD